MLLINKLPLAADFITFSSIGNATNFGDLTQAGYMMCGCSSSTRGVWSGGGGYNPYITAKAWAGNWLVLNSKEKLLQSKMSNECKEILRSLKWKNSRVRNGIPNKWLDNWIDEVEEIPIRDEVKELVPSIQKIKKL